jgi:sulfite exporter TauE/SafE
MAHAVPGLSGSRPISRQQAPRKGINPWLEKQKTHDLYFLGFVPPIFPWLPCATAHHLSLGSVPSSSALVPARSYLSSLLGFVPSFFLSCDISSKMKAGRRSVSPSAYCFLTSTGE